MARLKKLFMELFVGGGLAHGLWHADRGAETIKAPAAESDYAAHLAGEVGLGLVPVREDGTCRFGAIDVDVDTIDHAEVLARVKRRGLPLAVCRSKSGGAHLYVFLGEPGLAAEHVRRKLELWASLLGFPSSEIFPKQVKITKRNLGNWINLPYFAGDKGTRYAVGDAGAMTLEQFLAAAAPWDPSAPGPDESMDAPVDEMPPCLKCLSASGLPEGTRNPALFNFGVFFRKSDPQGWQDKLQQFNLVNAKPPLSYRELAAIAKSLGHARYQYTCEQSPIRELCDRPTCLKLKFGVAHKPWEELDQYDQILVAHLRKVLTTPPRYVVEVNGHDMSMSFEDFRWYSRFRDRVMQELDLIVRPVKQAQWDLQIKDLLKAKTDIDAPPDASPEGLVMDAFGEFLSLHDRARADEDLLKGLPIARGGRVVFRVQDFMRYLSGRKLDRLTPNELFMLLKDRGCTHARLSVRGRKLFAWSMPADAVNEQTEDFSAAEPGEPGEGALT